MNGIHEVAGSIPVSSTRYKNRARLAAARFYIFIAERLLMREFGYVIGCSPKGGSPNGY
jgi:hypothetical protein